ncbi:MAG TPA: tetratricopeptide repeat protein [Planctomycetota bacterium]|nr:tetratricopeptide repeat protein [Planctomycetota bacterium]
MDWWPWLFYLLGNWYFWPIYGAILYGIASPFIRRFRTWQAKTRFIRSQGAKLQNPQNADARFQLANIYAEGGSWRKALEYATDAVRVARENPLFEGQAPYHLLRLLGDVQYRRGNDAEAIDAYEQALKAKSDLGHGDARFGLGRSLLRKGDAAKAFDVINQSLEDNGSNLEGYFRLAQAAVALGRDKECDQVKREFWRVSKLLPAFAGKSRLRWRIAFILFPITRGLL